MSTEICTNGNRIYGEKREEYLPWDEYFMSVAFLSAMRSKDPSTQVGACIVSTTKQIVAIGYNGMPTGCSDDLLPWSKTSENSLETKYMYVCHAEMNAIMNKNSADVARCTIYVALFPCNDCAKLIIQSGIREVVYYSDKHGHKVESIASRKLLCMAGVTLRKLDPKCTSVKLDFSSVDSEIDQNGDLLDKLNLNGQSVVDINTKRRDYLAWEEYFMALAFLSAERSKDPFSQVGACVVNSCNKIVGIGYNGMPRGCSDDVLPWNRTHRTGDKRLESKYMYVCHAEMNAIMNKNCADVSGCHMYVAVFPCNECAKIIIQAGICEVIFYSDKGNHNTPEMVAARFMFDLAGVKYRRYNGKLHKLKIDFEAIHLDPNDVQLPPTPTTPISNTAIQS